LNTVPKFLATLAMPAAARPATKTGILLLGAALAALSAGCTNIERSRSFANPKVPPAVTAVQVCSNCHGVDGNAVSPNFPRLAAQQPAYLAAQLTNFRSHQRSDPEGFFYMYGISQKLTDDQIKGLADYFSAQVAKPNPAKAGAQELAQGKEIFEKGIPDKQVAACSACHGPTAQGMANFPRLANQHRNYLVSQLYVFQDTEQRPGTPMKQVTHLLAPQEIQAVAIYLQTLPVDK
jgi:cytochrome c553